MPESQGHKHDILTRITASFVNSPLVPLAIIFSVLLGVFAVLRTPSEEEPQIIVPMIDIVVSMPGAMPEEIEKRVVGPMEKLLWEIPGVEYVYSTAGDGQAMTIVRFFVGEDVEKSLIKTYGKLYQHLDWIPPGCSQPILMPRSIDDVPVLAVALTSEHHDSRTLRQVGAEVAESLRALNGVSEVSLIGGRKRALTIELNPERLRALNLDGVDVMQALASQNQADQSGLMTATGAATQVRLDNALRTADDVRGTVVAVRGGQPITLDHVATIRDAYSEPQDYLLLAPGPQSQTKGIELDRGHFTPAVTLTVAKRPGINATQLCLKAMEVVDSLKGTIIPHDIQVIVVRDYGETAKHKSDELLIHLIFATLSVGAVIAWFLGGRASLVIMVAVPVTLAVTLATYWLMGYTLNRVTLFALIFCIGILVDDPIVDVENIVRHMHLPGSNKKSFGQVIVEAVSEVRAPLVLATFTVIAAIMPMAFVGGLMGPYMRPMPIGASVAMLLSMTVAFIITPWLSKRLLKPSTKHEAESYDDPFTRAYVWLMRHLVNDPKFRWLFLGGVATLLGLAILLIPLKMVMVKMLPFDNKNEFEVVIDMPDGTGLETTAAVAETLSRQILDQPEVTDVQLYIGTAAPFSFNGLVRHYYLRQSPNEAQIQVNLIGRDKRKTSSHEIAGRVRELIVPVAQDFGARVKVVEVPPGPPVIQTLVAEIYGPTQETRLAVAQQVKDIFEATPGVVDVDWEVSDPRPETRVRVNADKALQNGVSPDRARQVLALSVGGVQVGLLHDPTARENVPIEIRLPQTERSRPTDLETLPIRGENGQVVSLGQIATLTQEVTPGLIYHKNMLPVVYVTADMAGAEESPVYGMARVDQALDELAARGEGAWQTGDTRPLLRLYTDGPGTTHDVAMKWDGEWQITYEVFRDMGIAFAVVLVLIAILVVGWFGSYTTPIAIMIPIPLSLIGIIPAHALAGSFFTATSMIGFIAGAGIVVRNSIILVDFIIMRRAEGATLEDAVVDAGMIRFRPMVLTAMSVVAGAFVILFDPIFQGLAISLMAGEVAATLFSRMVVPVMYYLDQKRKAV